MSECAQCQDANLSTKDLYDHLERVHVGTFKIFSCGEDGCPFSGANECDLFDHCDKTNHDVSKIVDVQATRMRQQMNNVLRRRKLLEQRQSPVVTNAAQPASLVPVSVNCGASLYGDGMVKLERDEQPFVQNIEIREKKSEGGQKSPDDLPSLRSTPPNISAMSETINGPSVFRCEQCDRQFDTRRGCKTHMVKAHSHWAVKSVKRSAESGVSAMSETINGPSAFCCELCDRQFDTRRGCKTHMVKAHSHWAVKSVKRSAESGGSDPVFTNSAFNGVQVKQETFPCVKCNRQFSSRKSLAVHRARAHKSLATVTSAAGNTSTTTSVADKSQPFACKYCKRTFSSNLSLSNHQRIHKQKQSANSTGWNSAFKCQQCERGFVSMRALNIHIGHAHSSHDRSLTLESKHKNVQASSGVGQDIPVCNVCNRIFKRNRDLKIHISISHPKDDSKMVLRGCNICGLRFLHRRQLAWHTKNDHPETLLAGDCDNKAKTTRSVTKRAETSKLEPVKHPKNSCQVCGFKAFSFAGLISHERRIHGLYRDSNHQTSGKNVIDDGNPVSERTARIHQKSLNIGRILKKYRTWGPKSERTKKASASCQEIAAEVLDDILTILDNGDEFVAMHQSCVVSISSEDIQAAEEASIVHA